jgi:PAS domain S-box-containing protein
MSRLRRFRSLLEDLGGLSFFAAKSERGFFLLAIAGGIAIFPFSLYNFVQGRPLVGWATGALAIWFLVNGVAVARGRRLMPAALVFLPTLGVLAYAMTVRGDLGVFWAYPAILLFHFILPRWTANLYNLSLILMTVSLAARWLTPEAVTRVAVTMVLTLVFTNIFSYLTERQRRREEAEEREVSLERDRLGLLVHATKAGFTDWDANTNEVVYSERFKEMLGYPADADTAGWPNFFERMHPEDRDRVQGEFRAMLRQKRDPGLQQPGQALDYRLRRADGTYAWVHAESLAQVDADLRIARFITSYQDISKFREQEALMREQHKFIGDVLDSLPIGLTMRDLDGKYVFVNRAWEAFTGSRREDVIGKTVYERAPKEEADRVAEGDRQMFARGPDAPPALQDMHHKGRRYILSRTVMTGADGKARGVLVASVDTTERYVMEQALASEQKRLELVVRAGSIGFLDWDGVAKTAYYSRRFKEILGYGAGADTSAWPDYFEMIHPEDRGRVQERFRRHIFEEAEEHETMQYRLKKADGSHVWVEAVGLSVRDAKGFATRFIASIRDISERRAQEEARLTEQRRLDLVVSAARVGIVDWDGRTHATFYSPRFREILGYAPDADTSAWPDYFRGLIHPEDRERITSRWRAFILGKGPEGPQGTFYAPEQYRLKRADGGDVWIQASGVAVRDEKGFVLRWIAAVTDITEQRVHEEALRETVRLREEVERMTRHDLKTPLNSIIAVPRLIREGRSLSSDEHQLLNIVERAGYRILNLVNLSLDLFRMEQGRYTFRPQAVDVADLVAKVIADLESQAASKSVQIMIEQKTQAVLARAEELLCYSMLANLLRNAIEASPEGGTVTVTLQSGLGVLVRVHNHGAVPEVVRERFFDKYSTAGKPEGLGLGTYSALLMARVQEGNITMRTSEEEGTTLTIQLAEATPDTAAASGATSSARGPARMPALPPLDVLVVDDDEFNRLVMRRYLPSPPLGKVAMAVNGRAAIEAVRNQRYDYIFLDLEMPVMSGYEAAGRIRALERDEGRKPAVLVAFSSNDDEASIRRALAAGCDHYLTKPAPRETLWKILAGSAPAQKKKSAGAAAGPADPVEIDADLRPTLPAFFLSRRETLDEVEALLGKDERAGARRLAHKLAGSFSLYGFKWAAVQCRQVERAAAAGDPAELLQRVQSVRAHLDSAQLHFIESAQA